MTTQKHLKQLVRARMARTGESYVTARRHVIRHPSDLDPPTDPATRAHLPGNVPGTTALRVLLTHAGIRPPNSREPLSEALVFGLAGGIGVGVFSFLYEKEDIASFFLAGRHLWQDDLTYLERACARLGIPTTIWETGGMKKAEQQLSEALERGPCICWVDAAHLPHRAMPASWSGGGYHVVTVYAIREGSALIGDLTDEPVAIPLEQLRIARQRIAKFKNRILAIAGDPTAPGDYAGCVRDGLRACHEGLLDQRSSNFTLEGLRIWGERLHGSRDRDSWDRVFPPGPRLVRGLVSIYDFIEHYGTGGGLCRPLFADFLREAAEISRNGRLDALADAYAGLGHDWSALAHAALPADVPVFRAIRELLDRKAELLASASSIQEVEQVWKDLAHHEQAAADSFPLSASDCDALRAGLQRRVLGIYEKEVRLNGELGRAAG